MTSIVLVRHGQTAWNVNERFRGRIDVPLNDTGREQAERAARAIAGRYRVAAVYSSPLSRAVDTGVAIARATGTSVHPLEKLHDCSYGEWEGKTLAEVEAAFPEQYRTWRTRPDLLDIPGGENMADLRARLAGGVEEVAARHAGETVVVVGHRTTCRVLACYFLGLGNDQLWRVDMGTASISLFEKRDGGWKTLLLNDECHTR